MDGVEAEIVFLAVSATHPVGDYASIEASRKRKRIAHGSREDVFHSDDRKHF